MNYENLISFLIKQAGKLPKNLKKYFPENSDEVPRLYWISRFEVNEELRTNKLSPLRYNELNYDIPKIHKALELATTIYADIIKKPTVMYRGVSGSFAKKIKPGFTFVDQGFVYLTEKKDIAKLYSKRKGFVLKVIVPSGQKGKIGLKDQGEFILPRFTKFEVIEVNDNEATLKIIKGD